MPAANPWKLALVLALLAPALAGCKESSATAEPEAPPPEVGVVTVTPQPRTIVRELPGRIAPTRVADVRPRVSGIIVERLFNQGSDVKAGEPLYQIDPKPFEVELQAAQAALDKARAALDLAIPQASRSAALTRTQAISTAQHEIAVATVEQARAEVAAREADVARARLSLDYATVRAPINGRIGAARVSEGALVVQNDATNLATIQQLDPIYADFTQSVGELNKLRRALESGELERIEPDATKVRLLLDDGTIYPYTGKLLFSEARVDASTGQVTLRGTFLNPDRELLSGMYVRVLLEQGVDSDAISLPEQAIQRNGGGGSEVFVVKEDNRIAVQPVRLGPVQGGQWLVLDGLKAGDRVVVDGFQKFAAGDTVTPRTISAEAPPERPGTTVSTTR
ncbi:efflux RND transporter periplasmic adaptor subunit [Reyranella sp.]|uniref:efflux RND transporter periplasmic adaptor subunit n=1 Tax=Reyranella sp. TaxID=1929291 RepID=UPI003BA89080